jgi:hypothetical protein
MVPSKTSIAFSRKNTLPALPASVIVTLKNAVTGTSLNGVTVKNRPPWLTIAVDSSNQNNYLLSNSINSAIPLTSGNYSAKITCQCPQAFPSKCSYTVHYSIGNTYLPSQIHITTSSPTVNYGDTVLVTAVLLSEIGDTFPVVIREIQWNVSSGESIDSLGRYICRTTKSGNVYIIGAIGNGSDTDSVNVVYIPNGYTFTKPDKYDTLKIGDTLVIQWISRNDINDAVIEISNNNGKKWSIVNANGSIKRQSAEWGVFKWKIPDQIEGNALANTSISIKIHVYNGTDFEKCPYKIFVLKSVNCASNEKKKPQRSEKLIINSKVINVDLPKIATINIYSVKGILMRRLHYSYTNKQFNFSLPQGVYLIKAGNLLKKWNYLGEN